MQWKCHAAVTQYGRGTPRTQFIINGAVWGWHLRSISCEPILPGYPVMKRNEISSYFKPCLFYLVRGWGTPKQNGHVIFVRPIFLWAVDWLLEHRERYCGYLAGIQLKCGEHEDNKIKHFGHFGFWTKKLYFRQEIIAEVLGLKSGYVKSDCFLLQLLSSRCLAVPPVTLGEGRQFPDWSGFLAAESRTSFTSSPSSSMPTFSQFPVRDSHSRNPPSLGRRPSQSSSVSSSSTSSSVSKSQSKSSDWVEFLVADTRPSFLPTSPPRHERKIIREWQKCFHIGANLFSQWEEKYVIYLN